MSQLSPCEEVARTYGFTADCCWTCHEDSDEYGYDMCLVDGMEVCCRVANKAEEVSKKRRGDDDYIKGRDC